ncbi:MAG: PEP-CTERM sorting domain-containing protein [Planctomycetaceae bacterium]|nr:PEP-CTERM sorting domain-containing protein [Planctomycetaceae bacterium]
MGGPFIVEGAIFSDNFNTENGGVGVLNYIGFANWTVADGTVDLIGNGYFDYQPGYGLYVDMDGSTNNAGKMISSVTINLVPGVYTLSFDLAGNQRNTSGDQVVAQVNMGVLLDKTYSLSKTAPFQTFTEMITVSAASSVQITFEGIGSDNMGMLLDNVKLENAVPEPTTLAIWSALGGLGLIAARRRRKTA